MEDVVLWFASVDIKMLLSLVWFLYIFNSITVGKLGKSYFLETTDTTMHSNKINLKKDKFVSRLKKTTLFVKTITVLTLSFLDVIVIYYIVCSFYPFDNIFNVVPKHVVLMP